MKKRKDVPVALDPSEWDFSNCPEEQLEYCCRYELARESRKIRCLVVRRRRQKINGVQFIDPDSEFLSAQRLARFLVDFEEFPGTAWLKIDSKKRENACRDGHSLFSPIVPVSVNRLEECEGIPSGVEDDQFHTCHALEIDWTASDDRLREAFNLFIATHKPDDEVRGSQKGMTSPRQKLTYLSAYRLMRFSKCANAARDCVQAWIDKGHEIAIAALYSDNSSWNRGYCNGRSLIKNGYILTRKKEYLQRSDSRYRAVEKARLELEARRDQQTEQDRIAGERADAALRKIRASVIG